MRHRKAGVKLGRTSSHRKAMFRNMVTSLFKYDRIRTTDTKAKALRGWADHMITLAKRGDLHARRQALSFIREKDVVDKLFKEAPDRFGEIAGGYCRVIKLGRRVGDSAPISIVELVASEKSNKKKKKKKKESVVKEEPRKEAVEAKEEAVEETKEAVEEQQTPVEETKEAVEETAESQEPAEQEADADNETTIPEEDAKPKEE